LPTIRIIGLSTFKERDHAIKMIEAGALAYLTKGCDPEALITAIESCMQHS
jgi:DNA-binding NarL/FixJ family response regulator